MAASKDVDTAERIANVCECMLEALHKRGFTREECLQLTCAILAKSNIEITNVHPFIGDAPTLN